MSKSDDAIPLLALDRITDEEGRVLGRDEFVDAGDEEEPIGGVLLPEEERSLLLSPPSPHPRPVQLVPCPVARVVLVPPPTWPCQERVEVEAFQFTGAADDDLPNRRA